MCFDPWLVINIREMSEKLWLSGEWLWKENMFISDKIRKIVIFYQLQKIATRFMSCKKNRNPENYFDTKI